MERRKRSSLRGFAFGAAGAALHLFVAEHRATAGGGAAVAIRPLLVGVVKVVFVGQFLAGRDGAHGHHPDAAMLILHCLAVGIAAVIEEHGGAEAVDDQLFAAAKKIGDRTIGVTLI